MSRESYSFEELEEESRTIQASNSNGAGAFLPDDLAEYISPQSISGVLESKSLCIDSPTMSTISLMPTSRSGHIAEQRQCLWPIEENTSMIESSSTNADLEVGANNSNARRTKLLERNRNAAAKCRVKKKKWVQNLECKTIAVYGQRKRLLTRSQTPAAKLRYKIGSFIALFIPCKMSFKHYVI